MSRETENKKMSQTASDCSLKTESHKEVPSLLSLFTSFCFWGATCSSLCLPAFA